MGRHRSADRRLRLGRTGLALSLATLVSLTGGSADGHAQPTRGKKVERPIRSAAADASRVEESYVRLHEPLPESAGPHPARCDWISYLRFRSVDGPRVPSRADAIFVSMPGLFGGASSQDPVARNVVRQAARRGLSAEYWVLDRRANCLEDRRGVRAAAQARDPEVGFDYYWRGREVDGKRFEGFVQPWEARFLSAVGVEQTVRDMLAVIKRGVPSQRVRKRKLFCGGHSLGGPLTSAFAGWDFDGDPATEDDAGYMQCAGFFGFDTSLGFEANGGSSPIGLAFGLDAVSHASPYLQAPPFTPETIQLIAPIGIGAYYSPEQTDLIDQLPRSPMIELSQRVLFSRDAANFATGSPSIRDFNLTNETVLAGIFDDNSEPVTILRASLGTTEGGPVVQKDFPLPGHLGLSAGLVHNDFLVIPSEPAAPLYSWRRFDRMDAPGAPVQRNRAGEPVTSAKSEVTDVHEFARLMFEPPADFAEQYFPTRILTDVIAASGGDRSGSLAALRHDGIAKRPAFLIQAGESDANTGAEPAAEQGGMPPNVDPRSGIVTVPGYNHVDVTVAAWRQNGNGPEPSSDALLDFATDVIGR